MLKRLLVPTLVLTVAGVLYAGCHDDSGNGTNKPMFTGSGGSDGAAGGAAGETADAADAADATSTDADGGDAGEDADSGN
jgi:hypothetical protein